MKNLFSKFQLVALCMTVGLAGVNSASAETLDSTIADTRTLAAFKVDAEALTAWLPDTHNPAPYSSGSFEGANMLMMFIDRMLHQDADGNAKNGGAYRMMALIVPGTDKRTNEKSTFISRVYSPGDSSGPYKTAVKSSISHSISVRGSDISPLSGRHEWIIGYDGGELEVSFNYDAGVPGRRSGESVLSTPIDPSVKRIYRFDQLTDVVMSKPKGVERTSDVVVRVSIPELVELFDGSEELIGLADRPLYTRTTWKP